MNENQLETSSPSTDTFETSDASSKGIVTSLTNVINFIMGNNNNESMENSKNELTQLPSPTSSMELLEKIKEDYTMNNYLWTGNIYKPAFEKDCRFTDPTLSFTGTDQFTSNVENLLPILDLLMETRENKDKSCSCKSDLLDISLNEEEGYIQTRWNMVGKFGRLPWKPKIDVIGRTKFWFRSVDNDQTENKAFKVYFYDEEWEIPASKALLQIITPDTSTEL